MAKKISEENFTETLNTARQAAELGREVLLSYFGQLSNVQPKKMAGLVTEADLESERVITEFLLKKRPELAVLAEEHFFKHGDSNQSKDFKGRWIIDPLDGTTNYVHKFPIFCISIGLEIDGEIVLGVIDAPILKQTFYACKGQGAFLNDEPIFVSQRSNLKDSLLATGFFGQDDSVLNEQVELFGKMIHCSRGIRRAGAAAYDLCMVASGIFDGFFERNLSPWDTAAGLILVKEAGGRVTNYENEKFNPFMKSILASNGKIHESIINHF